MNDFAFLAERINFEHAESEKHLRDAVEHAITCGELLIEAKRHVRYGEWLPWVKANLKFTDRNARRYMQIARNRPRVSDLDSIREAIAEVTEPRPKRPDQSKLDPFGGRWVPHLHERRPLPGTKMPLWWRCPHCGGVVH